MMDEQEILIRARAACAAVAYPRDEKELYLYREGHRDHWHSVKAAQQALRDAHIPLSGIAPSADPDLIEARKIAGNIADHLVSGDSDETLAVRAARAGIYKGRELERQSPKQHPPATGDVV